MKTKMKKLNIVLIGVLLALAMAVSLMSVETTNADDYRYTVRIFPGNRGTLPEDPYTFTVEPGQRIGKNFTPAMVEIEDARYVFVGLRRSGSDTLITTDSIESFEVNEDIDFVCAYAPASAVVSYRISYVVYDTGEVLDTAEYYGRVGDKLQVFARDFKGYTPRFFSVIFTLQAGEEPFITFEYDKRSESDPVIGFVSPETEITPPTSDTGETKPETIPKLVKKANPLKLTVTKKTFKKSSLTKAKSFNIGVTKAQGKVTYTLDKKAKKAKIKVSSKGKVTIPKTCKKGTYKITVTAAGNENYQAGKKTVTIVVK